MKIKSTDFGEKLINKCLIIILLSNWFTNHAANCRMWTFVVRCEGVNGSEISTDYALPAQCDWWFVVRSSIGDLYCGAKRIGSDSIEKGHWPLQSFQQWSALIWSNAPKNSLKCVLTIESKAKPIILLNKHFVLQSQQFTAIQRKQFRTHKVQCKIHCIGLATSHLLKHVTPTLPIHSRKHQSLHHPNSNCQMRPFNSKPISMFYKWSNVYI